MSYKLNKTDGTLLVDLIDGFVDTDTTNLTLIGRNYSGFGEFLNENFIKLLENFSNSAAPTSPLKGQLWYDSTEQRLKIYNGNDFVVAGSPFVQADNPQMVAGDLWINNLTKQLYFFDGSNLTLAGPIYTDQQGTSGFKPVSILDSTNRTRVILQLWLGGQIAAVISNLTFVPSPDDASKVGVSGTVRQGITPVNSGFRFYGTADSAVNLIDEVGGSLKNVSQFLPADEDGTTTGSLTIQNSGGVTIGLAQNNVQKIVGTSYVSENTLLDYDWKVRVRSSGAGSTLVDALTIKAGSQRIGVFQANPLYNLDVTGDVRITGDLIVEGAKASLDITTMRVEDKNIELAITDGSSILARSSLDDAGIIVRATGDDIKLTYELANDNWKSSESLNLALNKEYRINGTKVLDATSLGSFVVTSSLTSVGTLGSLDVDNINLDGTTLTTSSFGLTIASAGDISVSNDKITNLKDPTSNQDAATKIYVDTEIASQDVVISLDVTGLSDNQIETIIESVAPASTKEENTYCRIHGLEYSGTVQGIDVTVSTLPDNTGVITQNYVSVADANPSTNNVNVVSGIASANQATGTVTLNTTRRTIIAQVQSGSWNVISNVVITP